MEVTSRATVRMWDDEQGWGVLDSDATPGGCWTHFAALDFAGYRSLSVGQQVWLTAESSGQDGYPWRAVRVLADGPQPSNQQGEPARGAYSSELSIEWDQE